MDSRWINIRYFPQICSRGIINKSSSKFNNNKQWTPSQQKPKSLLTFNCSKFLLLPKSIVQTGLVCTETLSCCTEDMWNTIVPLLFLNNAFLLFQLIIKVSLAQKPFFWIQLKEVLGIVMVKNYPINWKEWSKKESKSMIYSFHKFNIMRKYWCVGKNFGAHWCRWVSTCPSLQFVLNQTHKKPSNSIYRKLKNNLRNN